jgi:hypothetical protein
MILRRERLEDSLILVPNSLGRVRDGQVALRAYVCEVRRYCSEKHLVVLPGQKLILTPSKGAGEIDSCDQENDDMIWIRLSRE